jgi:mannose-6-phosphate isomerase-like protein (cupin superfamily)
MSAAQQQSLIVRPHDGESVAFGGFGARFMVDAARSGGGFSLVEHPIAPRTLAAPVHTHAREDEYSYVLEGRVGFEIGGEVLIGEAGDLVVKPRGIPHAFWNPGDEPARVLEIISPGGFEQYFADIAPLLPPNRAEPDFEALGATAGRYALDMDMSSIERLVAEHGLDPAV